MKDWSRVVIARGRRLAEIEALRIAAAIERAAPDLAIEHKGGDVIARGRGLFRRMMHAPALRIARRWGR
ncbi:hypothetical protein [Sphingomicrobium aestuariivivum]|uniref:hypothetical protein n=1 Tax=Sphingomicrobium aestuariivivum TaxID=1582356 RepID=UPI001FD6816E|nr:hypothetical protein [Sphingomicrobium aestuariivivum]MCJ8191775.1 hypothetical protein [Sphingomicrobium aestuariivivum]